MTNKEALELALVTLERDNLKVGNLCVNYDIQKALIRLVKKELEKKKQKDSKDEQHKPMHPELRKMYEDYFDTAFEKLVPPQREWVGLTDEELLDIADMAYANDLELLQTLQAKLKEKNHG